MLANFFGKWDLIYFNFGLGDLFYKDPRTREIRIMSKNAGGIGVTLPKQYEENLEAAFGPERRGGILQTFPPLFIVKLLGLQECWGFPFVALWHILPALLRVSSELRGLAELLLDAGQVSLVSFGVFRCAIFQ
jgi:hypothetical protein